MSTLPGLLTTLTESLKSATDALPTAESLAPPANGISLLDTKNELFLSYLHNLVFLVVLKLRQARASLHDDNTNEEKGAENNDVPFSETVRKLVELRVYLERGVKPLEGRLRYQIDKVIRAADQAASKSSAKQTNGSTKTSKGKPKTARPEVSNSGSDIGSSSSSQDEEDSEQENDEEPASDLAYRPNPAAFARPDQSAATTNSRGSEKDTLYRPPRIAPTSLPTTESRSAPSSRRPKRSAAVEEYLTSISTAPTAEPSIGSAIHSRAKKGRQEQMTSRELAAVDERKRYEEENLVRLPGITKKEKRRLGAERRGKGGFGGEEWQGLGEGADRVVEATRGKGEGRGALERSRKRAREGADNDEGREGRSISEGFERKKKRLEARSQRSKGRKG
ncbi:hypothetical protein MMC10_003936 [Thelotrema lepadinum]|nr:hypothetical protein [Thelotrema lepadinum]